MQLVGSLCTYIFKISGFIKSQEQGLGVKEMPNLQIKIDSNVKRYQTSHIGCQKCEAYEKAGGLSFRS